MNPSQRATLRDVCNRVLGWQPDRVIWGGTPRPHLGGLVDATRLGLLELNMVSSVPVTGHEEKRATVAGVGAGAIRTVTTHLSRITVVQFDLYTVDPAAYVEDYCHDLAAGIQDDARNAELEAANVSLVDVGTVRALPFKPDGALFSRAALEATFHCTWTREDRTAEAGVIVSTYPTHPYGD